MTMNKQKTEIISFVSAWLESCWDRGRTQTTLKTELLRPGRGSMRSRRPTQYDALRKPPTTGNSDRKGSTSGGYSNDPRHGRPCACADGGFCRSIDAGHVPWRRQQSVADPGNKGVA